MTLTRIDKLCNSVGELPATRRDDLGSYLDGLAMVETKRIIDEDPELQTLTLQEIADAYNVSNRSLLRYIADGKLRAVRFGRKYLVTIAALREFLNAKGIS